MITLSTAHTARYLARNEYSIFQAPLVEGPRQLLLLVLPLAHPHLANLLAEVVSLARQLHQRNQPALASLSAAEVSASLFAYYVSPIAKGSVPLLYAGTSAFGGGAANTTPASGGLFGAPKPATTFGGFGSTPTQTQQPAAGGLFGGGESPS